MKLSSLLTRVRKSAESWEVLQRRFCILSRWLPDQERCESCVQRAMSAGNWQLKLCLISALWIQICMGHAFASLYSANGICKHG